MSEGAVKKEERRKFQAIKGTRDLLPPETTLWNRVEQTAHEVFATFGYSEIRLPIFEETELFARSIGLDTDIVSKEMYTFQDRERSEIPGIDRLRDLLGYLRRTLTAQYTPEAPVKVQIETDVRHENEAIQNLQFFVASLDRSFSSEAIPQTRQNYATCVDIKRYYKQFTELLKDSSSQSISLDSLVQALEQLLQSLGRLQLGYSLTLRPEATAAVCRAYLEHGMRSLPQPVKLYYVGPMFRREQPQTGRYRQFYQIDAEILGGSDAPAIDAELIEMVMTFFERLGLEGVELHINCIGDKNCRPKYVELLRAELSKVKEKLGPDSQRRIETNPLRVLDSKLDSEQKVIEGMPHIADHLCDECAENYRGVKKELDLRGVKYHENWRLVRGLDYYSRTTFEITAKGLGSQNAICGGGRYDGLMELLGGPPTRATGFAIGEDRLILSLQEQAKSKEVASGDWRAASGKPHVYIAWMGEKAYAAAIRTAKNLRAAGLSVELPPVEQKFAKALGQADKLGARYALILGDNEVSSGEWTLKKLADGTQQKLNEPQLLDFLAKERSGE